MEQTCKSEIQNFYKNSKLFITGATGFIGRLLVEKLLRSCPDITQIYLLVRTKRNKTPQERLDDIYNDISYERLRKEQPNSKRKIVLIEGDCELPDLGISEEDRKTLRKNVDIVFHVAASVRFNDPLRKMINTNIKGTRDLLKLAHEIEQLKMVVYISTAYAYCVRENIDEIFYETPIEAEKLITLADILEEDQLNSLKPQLIKEWPNSYVYTKAVAESLIEDYSKTKPVTLIRPSIVVSAKEEPLPGWINVWQGLAALTLGVALGIIRVMYIKKEKYADMIPVDYVVNNIIAATWKSTTKMNDKAKIYNYVASKGLLVNWEYIRITLSKSNEKYPLSAALWYCFLVYTSNRYLYMLYTFFLHTVPGWIVDGMLLLIGKKPRLTKIYQKVNENLYLLEYFMAHEWVFSNRNVYKLWKQLSTEDQKLFPFIVDNIDTKVLADAASIGSRIYLMNDPLDTLPQARRKQRILKIAHYTLITVLLILCFWLLQKLYSYIL